MPDYSLIDQSPVLNYIFYPRSDFTACPENAFDLSVPVGDNVSILCRLYSAHLHWPWILFFHGNGEVVSDYDEIAAFYNKNGLNIAVADYRGYGMSGGVPTLSALTHDAHVLFEAVRDELAKRGLRSYIWIMGRSLGSLSALELAFKHQGSIRGLIIESGFTSVVRIIGHLGMPAIGAPLDGIDQECIGRIKKIFLPALIIHGEWDSLVPLKEAQELYENLGTGEKELLIIPSANHNDILFVGFQKYFGSLRKFIERTGEPSTSSDRTGG